MQVICYCCGKEVRKTYLVIDASGRGYRPVCKSCQTAVRAGAPVVKAGS